MPPFSISSHACKNFYQKPLFRRPSLIMMTFLILFIFIVLLFEGKRLNLIIFQILRQACSISSDICTKFYQKPLFCRPYWIFAAILNCPRMPIWHHPDVKPGHPYQLISAKTFSIDAIARSYWVHAGLLLSPMKFISWVTST